MKNGAELPPGRPPDTRMLNILVPLALAFGYFAVRALVAALVPAPDFSRWLLRDFAMNLPRAFFLFLAWRHARRYWSARALGLRAGKAKEMLVLALAFSGEIVLRNQMMQTMLPDWVPFAQIAFGVALVVLLQELLLRGLLLRALEEQYGRSTALLGTIAASALFSLTVRPGADFPSLLIVAALLGFARQQGVSLWYLMLFHWGYDLCFAVWNPVAGSVSPFWVPCRIALELYLLAMYVLAYRVKILKPFEESR